MKRTTPWRSWLAMTLAMMVLVVGSAWAEPPAAPKVSTFAPAEDLVGQVALYLKRLDEATASESDYKDAEGKLSRDASTLVLIALALGLHDEDNKYKAAAPAIIKAAQEVAAAKDYASAKAAVAALKKAGASGAAAGGDLKWTKLATLEDLMEQVPLIFNSRLKRNLRRFDSKAKECAGDAATLAVIAQGSMANSDETKKPGEVDQWYKFCAQMRDAAAAVNKAIRAKDKEAAETHMKALNQSCEDCHAVFHPEGKLE